jgi:hypothetical protein
MCKPFPDECRADSFEEFMRTTGARDYFISKDLHGRPLVGRVRAACERLNEAGVMVMLSGPPSSGKSTLVLLSRRYGMVAKDAEDFTLKYDQLESLYIRPMLDNITTMAFFGGGTHAFRPQHYSPEVIRILLLPDLSPYIQRYYDRQLLNNRKYDTVNKFDPQGSWLWHFFTTAEGAFDIKLSNLGCPEQGLVDVCEAVEQWLVTPRGDEYEETRRRHNLKFYCYRAGQDSNFFSSFCESLNLR